MLFQTQEFLIFFLLLFVFLSLIRKRVPQIAVLLAASYFFYMSWNWKFILLILISTTVDYTAARQISGESKPRSRKAWLALSVITNLGFLGFFKYFNFFVSSIAAFTQWNELTLQIILPVGISFYTFQTMSYTIDVYLRRYKPTESFLEFALYVAYFPQLVAGPIVRCEQFLPQIKSRLFSSAQQIQSGAILFGVGLFKKVAIADNLSPLTDLVFSDPSAFSNVPIMLATLAFGIQIYCDFSGYTDMARGVSRLLGIELPVNFDFPYMATSFGDFWHRWHISLSTWLRDYLYIPLGGSRDGPKRTYVNLMTTMALGGLWHGAAWNFVIWGVYQGGLLCLGRCCHGAMKRYQILDIKILPTRLHGIVRWLWVQYFVFLGWLIFRVENFEDLNHCVSQFLFADFNFELNRKVLSGINPVFTVSIIALFAVAHFASYKVGGFAKFAESWSTFGVFCYFAVLTLMLLILWPSASAPFIYFQF